MSEEERYLDRVASVALQGMLAAQPSSGYPIEELVEVAHIIAEQMWAERERRQKARAVLKGERG